MFFHISDRCFFTFPVDVDKGPFTEKEKLLLEIAEYKLQVKILKEALKKREKPNNRQILG